LKTEVISSKSIKQMMIPEMMNTSQSNSIITHSYPTLRL